MNLKRFGRLLKNKRLKKGHTLREAAERIGVKSSSAIYFFEEGRSYPDAETTLKRICTEYGLNLKNTQRIIEEERSGERSEKKKKRYYGLTSAKYPSQRVAFLDHYYLDTESGLDDNFYSNEEIIKELKKYPLHIIEEKLLKDVNKRLTDKMIISYNLQTPESIAETLGNRLGGYLDDIDYKWSYDFKNKVLRTSCVIQPGKNSPEVTWYKLTWDIKQ